MRLILRILVLVLFLFVLPPAAHADSAVPGHGRKTAGLVLMIVGAAHVGVSVGTGASFGIADFRCHPPSCIEGGLGVAMASGFLVAGGVLSAIGIPLYAVGKRQEARAIHNSARASSQVRGAITGAWDANGSGPAWP